MIKKNQLCIQYREKYGWEMPNSKLARIIYNENKQLFPNANAVRLILIRSEGKAKRNDNSKNIVGKEIPERPRNPYNLPKSEETSYLPYKVDGKKILILSDIHIPYHSIEALTAAFDYAKKEKPDTIILNGDTLDFYSLSRFMKDPRKRDFAYELAVFKEFMDALKRTFSSKIVYKLGNHCVRYEHYLMMKAHELVGVEEFEFANILKARAEGIEIVGDKTIMKAGSLNIIHGHEFGNGVFSPVNIARGLYMKGKTSAIQGHNHQSSEHTESDMNGKVVTTWSLGCLSELHPAYMPLNKWNHGFAIVSVDGDDFEVQNKRIFKGKVL